VGSRGDSACKALPHSRHDSTHLSIDGTHRLSQCMGRVCPFPVLFKRVFLVPKRDKHCHAHRVYQPLPWFRAVAVRARSGTGEPHCPNSGPGGAIRIPGQCSHLEGTPFEAFRDRRSSNHRRADAGVDSVVESLRTRRYPATFICLPLFSTHFRGRILILRVLVLMGSG